MADLAEFKERLKKKIEESEDYADAVEVLHSEMEAMTNEIIDILAKRMVVMGTLKEIDYTCLQPSELKERVLFENIDKLIGERNSQLKKLGSPPIDSEEARGLMDDMISFVLEAQKNCPRPDNQ